MDITSYKIPGYNIVREIGGGRTSLVYLAMQETLGREVALKIIAPALATDRPFTERFIREGRIMANLNHPNIVRVFDCDSHDRLYYLSMELLPGGTLEQQMEQGIPLDRALKIIKGIAGALGYTHKMGLVHHDINPAEIMFREDGTPVWVDFGIAKAVEGDGSAASVALAAGGWKYMSPEQLKGKSIDARSNLYSLGMLLYDMLNTNTPPAEDHTVIMMHPAIPVSVLPPELGRFQPVLMQLLAKNPDERFQSVEEFIQALERVETEPPPRREQAPRPAAVPEKPVLPKAAKAPPPAKPAASPARIKQWGALLTGAVARINKRGALFIGLAVLVLAVIVGGALFWKGGDGKAGAETLYHQALTFRQEGKLQESLERITEGLRLVPDHGGLLALRDAVQKEQVDLRSKAIEVTRRREADRLLAQAQGLQREGKWPESLERIVEGLRLVPDHPDLLALQKTIQTQLARDALKTDDQARRLEVNRLLAQAKQQLQNAKLIQPTSDNAYATYLQVLQLEPTNSVARDGLLTVFRTYYEKLDYSKRAKQQQQEALGQILALIDEGLRVAPDHAELTTLRATVQKQFDQVKQAQLEIERLLTLAEQQVHDEQVTEPQGNNACESYRKVLMLDPVNEEAKQEIEKIGARCREPSSNIGQMLARATELFKQGSLTEPAGQNAFELYKQVLALVPDNAQAQQGVLAIADRYQELAEQSQRRGRVEQALEQIQGGLTVIPSHSGLLALRDRIKAPIVRKWLRQANRELLDFWWDRAYKLYAQVLQIDPDNAEAKKGLRAIGNHALWLAQQTGSLRDKLKIIDEGLRMAPDHTELLSLRQEVVQKMGGAAAPKQP